MRNIRGISARTATPISQKLSTKAWRPAAVPVDEQAVGLGAGLRGARTSANWPGPTELRWGSFASSPNEPGGHKPLALPSLRGLDPTLPEVAIQALQKAVTC